MQKIRSISLFLLVSIWPVVFSTQAISSEVNISGFGSIGVSATDSETPYLREMLTEDPSYVADTIIGLQFSGKLQPGFEYFAQWIAKDSNGHFDSNADWLLISFPINENLSVRGGRLRLPLFFLSKQIEVGTTYPWVRPPAEIYEMIEYTGYTGFDVIYNISYSGLNFTIQPFVGETTEDIDVDLLPGGPAQLSTDENFGIALQMSKDLLKFKVAYFNVKALIEPNDSFSDALTLLSFPVSLLISETTAEFYAVGAKYEERNWLILMEAAERTIRPLIVPDISSYYLTLGRNFNDLLIHATYAVRNVDGPDTTGFGIQEQNTTTLGIKYSPTFDSSFKIEWSYGNPVNGTAGLFRTISSASEDINSFSFVYDWIF